MSRFVDVPRSAFEAFFGDKGFEPQERFGELTYEREVSRRGAGPVKVLVYTTVPFGGGRARPVGKDAIRVSVVFCDANGKRHGVSSETKVLRTGTVEGVLERLLERMRLAWIEARKLKVCPDCESPAYADSGRCVVKSCRERTRGAPWA